MDSSIASVIGMGATPLWLVGCSCGVAAGAALLALRYRSRWLAAADEHDNSRDLIEHLQEGIYRSSIDGRQLSANRALVELNGYSSEAEMLQSVRDIGGEWYVEPGRRDEFRRILNADGCVDGFVSEVYRHKTRERIWITESARIVRDKRSGKPIYYEGSVREITETVKRRQLDEQQAKLLSQIPGGLFQYCRLPDRSFRILYYSDGFYHITGLPKAGDVSDPIGIVDLILPEDLEGFNASLRDSYLSLTSWHHEFRIRTPDGVDKWIRASAAPEKAGDTVFWHGYLADISQRKHDEIRIRELAYFDTLTRLPNRRALLDRLGDALRTTAATRRHGALLFIDLDNFKSLNDSQGHDIGDTYLVEVAERLSSCVEPGDLVARIGGDEFVVCIEDAGASAAEASERADRAAENVLSQVARPHRIGTIEHQASASVGIVVFDGSEPRVDEVLKRADIAMYRAKAAGRNATAKFDPAAMRLENEQFRLLAELRRAVAEDHFQIHFQPQVDRFGRVVAAEALLRWYHPDHGIIKPDRFIPLAERSGLINDIGRLVLDKGVRTLAEWKEDPDMAGIRLSINVSVKSFAQADFNTHLENLLKTHGIDPTRLMLEFTEHVMAENHVVTAERMRELKQLGIAFSLDDFGTGYSSLSLLKQLPFDEVKIDGSFVRDIETRECDRALVRTILVMAETLGLTAIAEQVETVRQEALLRSFGCTMFQGYLYSAPLAPASFVAYARANPSLERVAEELRRSA